MTDKTARVDPDVCTICHQPLTAGLVATIIVVSGRVTFAHRACDAHRG